MLTMTLAEKFGAGNCIRDMDFYLLFNRLSILVDVFKTSHLLGRGKAFESLCICMAYIPVKHQ